MPAIESHSPRDISFSRYLQVIGKFPVLTGEEEYALAYRFCHRQDTASRDRLITSHLRLVAKIAFGFRGYGLPIADLTSEGTIGLMEAVKRFDPDRGIHLSSYAIWWIRAEIQTYILHNWSLVKMGTTAAEKKLFFSLRRLKTQISAFDAGDLDQAQVQKIACLLEVPEKDVVQMNSRLAGRDTSLNAPMRQDGEGEWQDWLTDESDNQETILGDTQEREARGALFIRALQSLSLRSLEIITARRLTENPPTYESLAKFYGVDLSRIRQIEYQAIRRLERFIANPDAKPTPPSNKVKRVRVRKNKKRSTLH